MRDGPSCCRGWCWVKYGTPCTVTGVARRADGRQEKPSILALVAKVGVSLANYIVKLLPAGLEMKPRKAEARSASAVLAVAGVVVLAHA
jgi:hypothetical protein